MAEARKKLPQFTSERGTFRYPKLTEPDLGNEDYPKPDGEYSVQLVLKADSAEAKKMIATLTPLYKEAIAEAGQAFKDLPIASRKKLEKQKVKGPIENPLYAEIFDKETEEPTGEIAFKFGMKAGGTYKKGPKEGKSWSRKPMVFDAKGKRMDGKLPDIWGGTVGKVSFEAGPYFIPGSALAGLKLSLVAVQIIDLVQSGQRSAESLGFGEEEGYEHSPVEGPFEDAAETKAEDDGSGDF